MSGFRSSKQLLSITWRPSNAVLPSAEHRPATIFLRHIHCLAPRTPSLNTVDRRPGASVASRASTMAVGHLHPTSSAPVIASRLQPKPDPFHGLVETLKEALGPSSGLDSKDVDLQALIKAMRAYDANERGWVPYAFADPEVAYTRNLVDEGNGKSNLLVLVWTPGMGSPIHDHGNAHCIMKILHGSLIESRYAFPQGDHEQPMGLTQQTTYKKNKVAYMCDDLGLHKMENEGDDYAISLHLYTPPKVARSGCHTFNPITGEKKFCPSNGGGLYSKFTQRV